MDADTHAMTDAEFLRAFEAATIPKAQWTHEAHVRMAWAYLNLMPAERAYAAVSEGIRRYNAAVGGPPMGYHETITRAYFQLVRCRIDAATTPGWPAFREANADLLDRANPLMLHYYRKETLISDEARGRFVPPDLKALSLSLAEKTELIARAPIGVHLLRPDSRVISRTGWYQVVTPSFPHPFLNEVALSTMPGLEAELIIKAVWGEYRELGLPFKWCVTPLTTPASVGATLAELGFSHYDVKGMLLELASPAALAIKARGDVTVEEISPAKGLAEFLDTMIRGWETPDNEREVTRQSLLTALGQPERPRRFYLARMGGKPAGTASVFLGAGSAYLVGGNVLPEFRRRGVYRALIAARLELARSLGLAVATSQARAQSSAPILTGLGFETVYESKIYLSP